jgi:hypothetical protein
MPRLKASSRLYSNAISLDVGVADRPRQGVGRARQLRLDLHPGLDHELVVAAQDAVERDRRVGGGKNETHERPPSKKT